MYATYPRRVSPAAPVQSLLIFPDPNESLSDLSEFTLLEGSSVTSFGWSDSDISLPQQPAAAPSPSPTIVTVYPRRTIPLLGFFAALLAIDDATLHLLEHSHSTQSPLFTGPALTQPGIEQDTPDTQHGLFRLLTPRSGVLRAIREYPKLTVGLVLMITTVIRAVEAALDEQPVLRRRISAPKRRSFALDLGLIALDLPRASHSCAWLVDVVGSRTPKRYTPIFCAYLARNTAIFDGVQHLWEPSSEQSFFVNSALRQTSEATVNHVAFVLLGQDPQLLVGPPPGVLATLRMLVETTTPALSPGLEPRTAIPLAAVLLGYLVAYVPEAEGTFLAQATLDVYECRVRTPGWEHALLKFSCPAALAATYPERLASARLVASLRTRFEPRLKELGLELIVEQLDRNYG
ncbi:hypothetical protein DFH06DRAFT_1317934 [Mycena polygramma]|nr:hypothetical protein DFH06DRAFT_1317934 [Mycena polygramma]